MGQVGLGLNSPGQAEVGNVRLSLLVNQDVRRLQVAVEDTPLVGVVDRQGGRGHQPRRGPGIVGEFSQPLVQAGSGDQPHTEE